MARYPLLWIMMILVTSMCLHAQPIRFPKYKCQVTLPEGWQQSSESIEITSSNSVPAEVIVVAKAPPGPRAFTLYAEHVEWTATVNESTTDLVRHNWQRRGWTVTGSRLTTLAGVNVVVWSAHTSDSVGTVGGYGVYAVANGYGYYLVFMDGAGRAPSDDPDVQRIVDSFVFIGEPGIHQPLYTGPPRELTFPDYHCAITLPTGWNQGTFGRMVTEQTVMIALNSTSRKEIRIQARPIPDVDVHDSAFVAAILSSLTGSQLSVLGYEYMDMGGKQALAIRAEIPVDDKTVASLMISIGGKKFLYAILVKDFDGKNSLTDPEILKIIRSFRITDNH